MNIEIGAKIKQLRTAMGMTQEQLGNELSVSAQAVSKW
ncbi:MAG: helix-turn-helix transcriptional regulator, partial [Oscillospiraceae bacterium]|nr:helix-turn-helix transcriptional regulator [Oscillospiraceae bacterium]